MTRVWKRALSLTAGLCLALALGASPGRGGEAAPDGDGTEAIERGLMDLWYTNTPLERVLERLSRAAGDLNIRVVVEKEDVDQETIERMPVSLELNQVNWRTALKVLAKKYNFVVDWSMEGEGVVWLQKMTPVTHAVAGMTLEEFFDTIRRESGASIAVSPRVEKGAETGFSGKGLPWKVVLQTVADMHNLVMKEDEYGVIRIFNAEDVTEKMEPKVFNLRYISAEGPPYRGQITNESVVRLRSDDTSGDFALVSVLQQIASEGASISYVRETNQIVARDTPTKLAEIQRIIRDMDRAPLQVQIDTRLLTLREGETGEETERTGRWLGMLWANGLSATAQSGIRYDSSFPFDPDWVGGETMSHLGPFGAAVPGTVGGGNQKHYHAADTRDAAVDPNSPVNYGMGTMDFTALRATLEMLERRKNVEILQAPSIVTMDNEEATIRIGEVIRWADAEYDAENGTIAYKEASNSPLTVGVQLMVVPRVVPEEDRVILTVVPVEEEFDNFADYGEVPGTTGDVPALKLPLTKTKMVVTRMMLENRETGVIAGLLSDEKENQTQKVPLLGDVPVLGRLFRHEYTNTIKQEVAIFITPTIIKPTHGDDFDDTLADVRGAAVAGYEEK